MLQHYMSDKLMQRSFSAGTKKRATPKGRPKVQTGKPSLEVHVGFVSDETHLLDVSTLGNCEHFVDEDIFRFRLRL